MRALGTIVVLMMTTHATVSDAANQHYPVNRDPLIQTEFVALPLGAVKPLGWLKDQLTVQGNGLTGHLDEFWPSVSESAWRGADGDAWERGPYYLDGLVPLGYLLDDKRLQEKAQPYIEFILASGQDSGWFGPAKNSDRWPLSVALKVLTQYHEATGDERVLTLLQGYFRYLKTHPPDWPDKDWRGVRAMEHAVTAFWLYRRTGDADLLKVVESIFKNSFDWPSYFLDFPFTTEVLQRGYQRSHQSHVVNLGMALKYPGLWYQQSRDDRFKKALYEGMAQLDQHHGQVAGRFSGDEHVSGRHPSQGTELCGVVEYMFSLENLVEILGDPSLADRLELLAYNANPGACTPDYWAHQYDQQANQVLCTVAHRNWSDNSDYSNLYGLEPNYGCCTANMHQGWPKFVSHMWMATHDQGLAAVAHGPSEVKAKVAGGADVAIRTVTEYPFDGTLQFTVTVSEPVAFPLYFRIPGWAEKASIEVAGETIAAAPGTFAKLERTWKSGEQVTLKLPMGIRTETRYNNSTAILRGPLYYSLRIGEHYQELARHHEELPVIDWAIYPTTRWNYGLLLDRENPENSITVQKRRIGDVPFDGTFAPVVLNVKGRAIPQWVLVDNSAGTPPASPLVSLQPVEDLELVPYGSARLRITEFPVLLEP